MNIAAIDIGSNTFILTIANVEKNAIKTIVADTIEFVRLSEGVMQFGNISEHKILLAENVLRNFRNEMLSHNVQAISAAGTSVMRDAANAEYVKIRLEKSLGANIDIVSGKQEAQLTHWGCIESRIGKTVVLDIGGRSAEITIGNSNEIIFSQSFDIGAVRIKELFFPQLPPSSAEISAASVYISKIISNLPSTEIADFIGTSGTPISLAAMYRQSQKFLPEELHGEVLSYSFIEKTMKHLCSSSMEELQSIPGMDIRRMDILPAGSLILLEIMKKMNLQICTVSSKGMRHGLLQKIIRETST